MITYLIKDNSAAMVSFNNENNAVDLVNNVWSVDYMYVIPEDGVLSLSGRVEKVVKKGNIVLKMYAIYGEDKKEIFILDSPELADFYVKKEEAEKRKSNNDCCCKCKACNDCCCSGIEEA